MCCMTHEDRDRIDRAVGVDVDALLARREEFRCRCAFGCPCQRQATAEDQRCDWCRGTNHDEWCAQAAGAGRMSAAYEELYPGVYSPALRDFRVELVVARPQPVIVTGVY